ncbi:putative uncharacterized protein DDB_G0292292 isoform X2 [Leptopilina boulardi]|uniref:putative uncharacterized protein DDB_G0292292 isoform X2 n=1 Tax=Leptopilina boulardi TaxID=63433 RepID=UPI0021F5EDA9|nr:putative uncharacterized protein DDB_G0292292 isoform X2 [Leptopilina boulardi]
MVHRYQSTYENDWRPVTHQETIKYKPPTSTNIWTSTVPVYPDLKKLQEYLVDPKILKPQNNYESKENHQPKILGNYNHFTQTNMKLLPSETRKYSFLLPTNRDPFILQDNSYTSRTIKPNNNRDGTQFYSNIPKSFLMSEVQQQPTRQHFFTANIKPSYPSVDRPIVTYMNQNLNKPFSALPSVEFSNKFLNNNSVQQYYNRNIQPENSYFRNSNNNYNIINQTNSPKINKENEPNNLIDEYPEKNYVTALSKIKLKPVYQNYMIPTKFYPSNLLPMQVNYLHHYSTNVKKNHSEINTEDNPIIYTNANSIEKIYNNMFRGTSVKNNKDLTYITPKYENFTQKEAYLQNTTPDTQQYFQRKIIPEHHTIQNKYREQENIDSIQYNDNKNNNNNNNNNKNNNNNNYYNNNNNYNNNRVSTSPSIFLNQELPKQNEFLSIQNKYNEQEEELKVYEKQERIKDRKESLRYSEISDQTTPEKYKFGQEVELENVFLNQHNPQKINKSLEFYENVLSKIPVTNGYIVTTELPVTYYEATHSPIKDIRTETFAYTSTLKSTTELQDSGRKPERVKSHRLVGKHRRRPISVAQKSITTPTINIIALNQETTTKFEAKNKEDEEIITEINTKLINYKNDSKIETKKEFTHTTENPTEEIENNYPVTEELIVDDRNNYEYIIASTQTSIVNNQDFITEPSLKLSTINNYEKIHETDNILTTTPTDLFTTKHESKILSTSPTIMRTTSKIRFSRPANTLRPRFSVKDYKSKLDDKNRKSTTESSTENIQIKKKSPLDRNKFENTIGGRYKYMSRISYRPSSTTPLTESQENSTQIRKKINKYSPKERLNLLNISRVTPPTFITSKLNSAENLREKNYSGEHRSKLKAPSLIKSEIDIVTPSNVDLKITPIHNNRTIKPNFNLYRYNSKAGLKRNETLKNNNLPTLTSEQEDELILEKASQSVSDLTSSASSLHNKASMSKKVSPTSDKTAFLSHFKSTYGTPTLPIEAFFHDLSAIAD